MVGMDEASESLRNVTEADMSDWAAMPLGGDADSILSSLEQGLSVSLITTFDPCCCDADDDLKETVRREDLREFDYLPVKENDEVAGLLHRAKYDTEDAIGLVKDAMCNLRGDLIISASAGILSYIVGAKERPCRLVLQGSKLNGIVTLSDFQKLPVRPALFLLITHVELLMAQWLRKEDLTEDKKVLENLCAERRKKVNDKWKGLKKRNLAIDILSATDFGDKVDLLQNLGFPANDLEMTDLRLVEKLRNSVAHAGDYALSPDKAENTIKAVKYARDWIERLQNALDTRYEDDKVPQEAHRSRPSAGRYQQGVGQGEVHSPRPPLDAAPVVGAAPTGRLPGSPLRLARGRPLQRPARGGGEGGARPALRHPGGAGQVGELER